MRFIFLSFSIVLLTFSCSIRKPFTDQLRTEYNLSKDNLKKVQFYTSAPIILEKSISSGQSGTGSDGALISSKNSTQNRIIIPANTKCIFEEVGKNNEMIVRFETGRGKVLQFSNRNQDPNARYFFKADWNLQSGGKVMYGDLEYVATASAANSFLVVKIKNSQRTKRSDRIVKGMKVN